MTELKECPKCKGELKLQPTVQLKGNNVKKVGEHHLCLNMNCDFEIDL